MNRLYNAVCSLIEARAALIHSHTLESEMEQADWAEMQGYED